MEILLNPLNDLISAWYGLTFVKWVGKPIDPGLQHRSLVLPAASVFVIFNES